MGSIRWFTNGKKLSTKKTFLDFAQHELVTSRSRNLDMDLSINEGTLVVTGGPGDTPQTAIVIKKTPRGLSAAGAETMLLGKWFGQRGKSWTLKAQTLLVAEGRTYDVYDVVMNDGTDRRLYFDVTEWLSRAAASR